MHLKFDEIQIDKDEFHKSKKPVELELIYTNKVFISDRFELDEGDKYYIGYKDGEFVRPLCIIPPQMSGYIKYFDGTRKNMSFLSDNVEIIIKYNKIWKNITKTNGLKLDSQPVYYKKHIKTKLKTYDDKVNTVFSGNAIPKEKNHYSCIAAICIDFVLKWNEENYPQVYLE